MKRSSRRNRPGRPPSRKSSSGNWTARLGIIVSVWLDPAVVDAPDLDHAVLFRTHREATAKALGKAMRQEPSIDWLLENQEKGVHYYHQLGLDGQL